MTSRQTIHLFCSHIIAGLIGACFFSNSNVTTIARQIHYPSSAAAVAAPSKAKEAKHRKDMFDLIPVLVLEHEINDNDFRLLIMETNSRIRMNTTLSIGPLHIYYPDARPNINDYVKRNAHDFLNDAGQSITLLSVANTRDRAEALKSLILWQDIAERSRKALCIDISSVMCSKPTYSLEYFYDRFDWIGAVWPWASADESSLHHYGGNGAFSLRSPQHLVQILLSHQEQNGNEDMFFVKKLREWRDSNETKGGVSPPKLPGPHDQSLFAVETLASPPNVQPVGIYHLMVIIPYDDRQRMIDACPEAKRLFRALHEPTCVKFKCPKNISQYNKFEWEKRFKQKDFDDCSETCNIYHHPVAAALDEK